MATLDNPNPTIFKPKKETLSTSLWIDDFDSVSSSSGSSGEGSSGSEEDEVEAIDAAEIFGALLLSLLLFSLAPYFY